MMTMLARAAAIFAAATALLTFGGISEAVTRPAIGATNGASAGQSEASGSFTASVDFSSLVTRDVGASKCEFQVQGTLTFTGTVEGEAVGTTTALIDAPCPDALSNPPGTFRDVFRFVGLFNGAIDGVSAAGELSYAGVARPGGSIDANIQLRASTAKASLRTVDAELGRGGTYRGVAVTRS